MSVPLTTCLLGVWATGDQEGACGGFNWGSIYPQWWWSCNHEVADRECIYCWRQHQSQPFGDQYSYYLASAQTCQPGQQEVAAGSGRCRGGGGGVGGGYPQGLHYNIPARDAPPTYHSHGHSLSHERVRARASHPAQLEAYGKVLTTNLASLSWHAAVVLPRGAW